jgi:23S rRNA pseudouridine955/2504/2580 synthase
MTEVRIFEVSGTEADIRLDRWFKRRIPGLTHGRLEKLLRTGQVRVDGAKAKSGQRLEPGQKIRVPPLPNLESRPARVDQPVPENQAADLRDRVLFKDSDVIALNKAPGLAVQGGTGLTRHLDGMLEALRFDSDERPRLVHRLDKDTSGVLLLARTVFAASALTQAFRDRTARKTYWGLTVGVPTPPNGTVATRLAKSGGEGFEKMREEADGKSSVTRYRVADRAQSKAAWVVLSPETGRTHQLRAHMNTLGTPIAGDRKYGGASAVITGISSALHLHARRLDLPAPSGGRIQVEAPLPKHMAESWKFLGFDENDANGVAG